MLPLTLTALLLLITATSVMGKLIQLKVDAASRLTGLYIDGERYKGSLYHDDNWKRLTKINIEENSCLLALSAECPRNTGCFAGLIFCDDGCRFYSSKPTCHCTKSVEHVQYVWFRPQFTDSSWPSAYEHYPVNSSRSPYKVLSDQLCPNAVWVWTPSIYDEKVYCRCRLRVDGGWSEWSTCSNGVQTRQCNNPTPSCTGASCDGDSTRNCSEECPTGCSECHAGQGNQQICTKCETGYVMSKNNRRCVPQGKQEDKQD